MSESEHLAAQVARTVDGDPWYGDPILKVLSGVSLRDAESHPIKGGHSIWELVLHMTSWTREVNRRLATGVYREPADGDWPAVPAASEANWKRSVDELAAAHAELQGTIAQLSTKQLDEQVGKERDRALGTGVTFRETIHGILQHDAYHLGQVSLLKRALRSA